MFDYIVMNADGFHDVARGEVISFSAHDEVNAAIAEGAILALPHAAPPSEEELREVLRGV